MSSKIKNIDEVAVVTSSRGERFGYEIAHLAVSTKESPEVVDYPDSGKLGILVAAPSGDAAETFRHFTKIADAVDYWEGEQ